MVMEGNVESLVQEIFNLKVGVVQLLCLENHNGEKSAKEDKRDMQLGHYKIESFQNKYWF